jgi:hypothetical protein
MHKQLLFFFYTVCIDINAIVGINIFLLPFYLYLQPSKSIISIFWIIALFFIILFITCNKIKNHILAHKEKSSTYLYFLSDYFYYITLLCIMNTNIFYINKIFKLYNNIPLFYNAIAIVIILFLFILIKNNTSNINNILCTLKLMIIIPALYFLYRLPVQAQHTINTVTINNLLESIPILFFSYLGNDAVFHIDEKIEDSIIENNTIQYKKIILPFVAISILYTLLYRKISGLFFQSILHPNTTISEILLKQNPHNTAIHILNIIIIIISFFGIYTITLKCQKIIEKIIEKTTPDKAIPENIILFFVLSSILITSKIVISEQTNILFTTFFSTLSFLCYLTNTFTFSEIGKHTVFILISIFFLLIIHIMSIYQLIHII